MEYEIKILGNPVLKQETEPVTEFNSELAEIVENMIDAMYDGCGIGLAAPQVGLSKKIIVVDEAMRLQTAELCLQKSVQGVSMMRTYMILVILHPQSEARACFRAPISRKMRGLWINDVLSLAPT